MKLKKLAPLFLATFALVVLPACTTTKTAATDADASAPREVVNSPANKGGMSPVTPPRAAATRAPVVNSPANKGGAYPVTPPVPGSPEAIAPTIQEVTIRSTPSGAAVSINGQPAGVTPLAATFEISKVYNVTFKQPGYYIETVLVRAVGVSGGGYMVAKGGAAFTIVERMPTEINATLTPVTDKYAALTKTVGALDDQLKAGKLTPEQHKQQVAEAVQFYGQ